MSDQHRNRRLVSQGPGLCGKSFASPARTRVMGIPAIHAVISPSACSTMAAAKSPAIQRGMPYPVEDDAAGLHDSAAIGNPTVATASDLYAHLYEPDATRAAAAVARALGSREDFDTEAEHN